MNAIDIVRQMVTDGQVSQEVAEKYFPELKESEGERIRKWLIRDIKQSLDDNVYNDESIDSAKEALAWLEKQDEMDMESYKAAEDEKREFVGDGFVKCYADFQDFKDGETYWLEYVGNDNYNVRSDNLLGKTYHITPCQLYTVFKKQTWLEKQGEKDKEILILKDQVESLHAEIKAVKETHRIELEKQGEQKPAWSEEDDKNLEKAIWYVEKGGKLIFAKTDKLVPWLKSIKDRVQPHPKQEVDEQIETIAVHLDNCGNTAMAEILRSCNLRPQKHWKPTEEQLTCLEDAVNSYHKEGYLARYLTSLLNELKAL